MYILGINSVYHESCACLLKDGMIVAIAEEERFNRIKHGKKASSDNPHELPMQAIQYCLDAGGITFADIAHAGFSFNPQKLREGKQLDKLFTADGWGGAVGAEDFNQKILTIPGQLQALGFTGQFTWVDHHVAHASSAFHVSPFREAAVLTVDGIGETSTALFMRGENNRLDFLQEIEYPASLGFLWELMSLFLGFSIYDAAKIMGLASYGEPELYASHFKELVRLTDHGAFEINDELLRFELLEYYPPSGYYHGLETLFGVKKRSEDAPVLPVHQHIAAALQQITNEIVLHMVNYLYATTRLENLCLAGGVALNCVTNRYVFEEGPFSRLYVQPAAHDAGTALGVATYIWHHIVGGTRREYMQHAYTGPSFTNEAIEQALTAHQLTYHYVDNIEQQVARLVSEGHVVGFFQGRMELGPRALGNRSLLADPRNPNMREILNHKVKHREYFRPFAPSVLYEEAHNWFHIKQDTSAMEYMLMVYPVKADVQHRIPAVVHVDGTGRIQAVKREINPRYHKVIAEFFNLTGVPVVLNTSFNDSEPIVCTPDDAINTFTKTEIDYLAIGDFLVSKNT